MKYAGGVGGVFIVALSHGRFVPPLIHFIPDLLRDSVALSEVTLQPSPRHAMSEPKEPPKYMFEMSAGLNCFRKIHGTTCRG
jgi:hypothetical protein